MHIYVDADACPVKDAVLRVAREVKLPVTMLIDTSHELRGEGFSVITVGKGPDAVDLKLMNLAVKGDVVVTQDYGLAALALGKGCRAINQNGLVYSGENIDFLLAERHNSAKLRRAGGKSGKQKKRTSQQNELFEKNFRLLIRESL